jgi:hypothetical protein
MMTTDVRECELGLLVRASWGMSKELQEALEYCRQCGLGDP